MCRICGRARQVIWARGSSQVAGVRARAMMAIHTVAAGGGSILHFDGARYRVGPDSASANPWPCVLQRTGRSPSPTAT